MPDWRKLMHRTNVELDEKLVKEGMRLFNKRTKKELIRFALSELIRHEKAKGILDLEGKVEWEGDLKSSTWATAELLKERKLDKKREDKKFARRRAQ
jgi:Arc/MetJ family transcription regulator